MPFDPATEMFSDEIANDLSDRLARPLLDQCLKIAAADNPEADSAEAAALTIAIQSLTLVSAEHMQPSDVAEGMAHAVAIFLAHQEDPLACFMLLMGDVGDLIGRYLTRQAETPSRYDA